MALIFSAMAYTSLDFPGWPSLEQKSDTIVIARCKATPDPNAPDKDGLVMDNRGLIYSEMQIVSILKGTTNSNAELLKSEYWPRQGEYYLIFAKFTDNAYQAYESYRVIPLGISGYVVNGLKGKTLDEQVQTLLQLRLDALNRQMSQEQEEMQRLKDGVNK